MTSVGTATATATATAFGHQWWCAGAIKRAADLSCRTRSHATDSRTQHYCQLATLIDGYTVVTPVTLEGGIGQRISVALDNKTPGPRVSVRVCGRLFR